MYTTPESTHHPGTLSRRNDPRALVDGASDRTGGTRGQTHRRTKARRLTRGKPKGREAFMECGSYFILGMVVGLFIGAVIALCAVGLMIRSEKGIVGMTLR